MNKLVFAQQNNFFDAIYLNLIFDGKELTLNKNKPDNKSLEFGVPSLDIQGFYIVEFYKENNELITKLNTNLKRGENEIFLPWILNAKYLVFKDSRGKILGKIDISEFLTCNENRICEPTEEYLCSLDCKNTNNPFYPFTQKLDLKPVVEQVSYPLPSQVFNNIFFISIIGFITLLIIILIVYLRKR